MTENGNRYAKQVESALAKQKSDTLAQGKKLAEDAQAAMAAAKEFDAFLRNEMDRELKDANEGLAPHGYGILFDIGVQHYHGAEGEPIQVLANSLRFWVVKDGRQVGETYHLGRLGNSLFRRDRDPGRPASNVNPFAGGFPGKRSQVPQRPLPPEDLTKLYLKGNRITLEMVQDFISDAINEIIRERPTLTERLFS